MEFTDTELNLIESGLLLYLARKRKHLTFSAATKQAEISELVSRIEHEKIARRNK